MKTYKELLEELKTEAQTKTIHITTHAVNNGDSLNFKVLWDSVLEKTPVEFQCEIRIHFMWQNGYDGHEVVLTFYYNLLWSELELREHAEWLYKKQSQEEDKERILFQTLKEKYENNNTG